MSYFKNELSTLNEGFRGTAFNTIYNIISRLVIDVPRILYKRTPSTYDRNYNSDYLAGNAGALRAALSTFGFLYLGLSPIFCGVILIVMTIIGLLSSINRFGDKMDQMLFNSTFDINKKVEDKLISLTDKKCRIRKDDILKIEQRINVMQGRLGSHYKSNLVDKNIGDIITKSMAFHIANKGDYVYLYYFNFDIDGIYDVWAINISENYLSSIDEYIATFVPVDISKIDPKLYMK